MANFQAEATLGYRRVSDRKRNWSQRILQLWRIRSALAELYRTPYYSLDLPTLVRAYRKRQRSAGPPGTGGSG